MKFAERIEKLPPYLFAQISKKVAAKKAEGIDVISFGIGDPDLPTPRHILDALHEASSDAANHRYPETEGLPDFREAVARWYERRFAVRLNPANEVISLIGSKEGIGHIALCFVDPGDVVLVPDPAYPVYEIGTLFAGGSAYPMPLREEHGFLPDFSAVPLDVASRAKILWLNYPNNPTGAVADIELFEEAVHFAKRHGIAVCHDGPYSEVAYDGYRPVSFLQAKGAMDVGVEFHSLSKSYNMTGWRIGTCAGNARIVDALMRVKSNIDSGVSQAIQRMAIAALDGPQDGIAEHNAIYQRRRDKVVDALRRLGLRVTPPKASLYVWARVPSGMTSAQFAERLLDEAAVIVTPGNGYGPSGEGYVRLSLTVPDDRIDEGLRRIAALPALA